MYISVAQWVNLRSSDLRVLSSNAAGPFVFLKSDHTFIKSWFSPFKFESYFLSFSNRTHLKVWKTLICYRSSCLGRRWLHWLSSRGLVSIPLYSQLCIEALYNYSSITRLISECNIYIWMVVIILSKIIKVHCALIQLEKLLKFYGGYDFVCPERIMNTLIIQLNPQHYIIVS